MAKVKKMAMGGMRIQPPQGQLRPPPALALNPGRPGSANPMQGQPRPSPALAPNPGRPGSVNPMQGHPRPPPALAPNPGRPGPVNPGMGPKPMMGGPRPSPNPGKPGMGMKKGGSASSRADGVAQKGKTKGRIC